MKFTVAILLALVAMCAAVPAPVPAPAPGPKADPSLVYTSPALVAAPALSYSHYYRSPLYTSYTPYAYNYGYASGYASGYPYGAYPYYVL